MIGLDAHQTGVFLGGTIHDVAQVVGAGYSVSPAAGDSAVLTKMLRVAMLLPVVMALSLIVRHRLRGEESRRDDPLMPPLPPRVRRARRCRQLWLDPEAHRRRDERSRARLPLAVAIAAVGLKTSPLEMKKVGGRAIALLGVEAVFLAGLVIVAQKLTG